MEGQTVMPQMPGDQLQGIIQVLITEAPQIKTQQGQQGVQQPVDQHAYNEWITRVELLLTEVPESKRVLLTERLDAIRKRATGSGQAHLTPDVLDLLKGMDKAVNDGTLL